MADNILVLIADDHALIRQGLVKLLEFEPGVEVVGQARDGWEAVEKVKEFQPHVVLMDINMPALNGIEATRRIREQWDNVHVLALTIHDDEEYISEMIRAGASGYLLKDAQPGNVLQAIRRVAAGESYLPSTLMGKVMERYHQLSRGVSQAWPTPQVAACRELEALTQREFEVLECIVQGKSNREIAKSLFISEKTVKNHVTNVFRKLEVTDRTQAAVYALKHGISPKDAQT